MLNVAGRSSSNVRPEFASKYGRDLSVPTAIDTFQILQSAVEIRQVPVDVFMKKRITIVFATLALAIVLDAHAREPIPPPSTTAVRARDLGIPFDGTPGKLNAITDVAGVEVGYATLISGEGKLERGKGPVRTRVKAIITRGHD
jgi:hypothetical protein